MPAPRILTADRGDAGQRLDLVLRRHLADVDTATRTRVQTWIENGLVAVNGSPARRPASRAALGDVITVALPDAGPRRVMAAEELPLRVLYEDDELVAIDKPAGMIVHPGYRHTTGTVMNALLWRARTWTSRAHPRRPSIVGRLDKDTSGIVIAAKSAGAHAALQRAMASRGTEKEYLAVVYGRVSSPRGRIELRLARDVTDRRRVVASATKGATSLTRFVRLDRIAAPRVGLSLLCCRLLTGRMHQIRVHLAARGWPIVGDRTYGQPLWSRVADAALAETLRAFPRQALHAWRIAFTHPGTRQRVVVEAPVAPDLAGLIANCRLKISECRF